MLRAVAAAAEESAGGGGGSSTTNSSTASASISNAVGTSSGSNNNRSSISSCCTTDADFLAMEMSRADPPQTGDVGILSSSEAFSSKNSAVEGVGNLAFNGGAIGIPAAAVFSSASHGLQDLGLASSTVVANAMEAFSGGGFSVQQQQQLQLQQQQLHQPPVQPVQVVNQTLKDMGITPAGGVSALSATAAYRDIAISSASHASTRDIPTSAAAAAAAAAAATASSSGNHHHTASTKQNNQRPPNPTNQQPIICVPNQQAPYPGRPGKGPVIKHMTTAAQGNQRIPHIQHPQHIQHIHKIQQKPGGGMHVQTQQVSSGVVSSHVRHLQPQTVSNQRFPLQVASKSAAPSGRIPHQKLSRQAAAGQMAFHPKPPGKVIPSWLPQMAQGVNDSQRDGLCFTVEDRSIRISPENDSASEYALARRWVRNDFPRKDQGGFWESMPQLPKPLSAAEAEKMEQAFKQNGGSSVTDEDAAAEKEAKIDAVDKLTKEELLQHHISHFKNVRKRVREDRKKKTQRFRPRLHHLLPPT